MKILLAYATYSSGTEVVSEIIEHILREHQLEIERVLVKTIAPVDLSSYDVIIFGSPSWDLRGMQGQPHEYFLNFIDQAEGMTLSGKKFAIFGLGDTAYTYFTGCVDNLEKFVRQMQGQLLTPSLRIDGFFFDRQTNDAKITVWANALAKEIKNVGQ